LSIGGCKGLPLLLDENGIIGSYSNGIESLLNAQKGKLLFSNPDQSANDGMQLEASLAGAIVLSSHRNGIGGIRFDLFLKELLFNLNMKPVDYTGQYQQVIIPFMGPPNETIPDYLKEIGIAACQRTVNAEMVDFKVELANSKWVTGECKDYKGRINKATMEKILSRIPENSAIHIVVTNRLQKKYILKTTPKFGCYRLNQCEIYSVNNGNLSKIYENEKASCVVLFLLAFEGADNQKAQKTHIEEILTDEEDGKVKAEKVKDEMARKRAKNT
jgi:hypothetical protein